MKAARLHAPDSPLKIETIPEPTLRAGGALVRIEAAVVPAFTQHVLSGALGYQLPALPFTPGPGAAGVIEALADDVLGLEVGQRVLCDSMFSVQTPGGSWEGMLIGWTGLSPLAEQLQAQWQDGCFGERVLWPAECLVPVPDRIAMPAEQLVRLGYQAIAYGGLLRGNLRPGQRVIISGATGALGCAAVSAALALGASEVIAVGRNRPVLNALENQAPGRVRSIALTGELDTDGPRIAEVAQGAELMIDLLGGVQSAVPTLASLAGLGRRGTAVFVGGVQAEIPLPYPRIMLEELTIRGSFMYPRSAIVDLLRLVDAGLLDPSSAKAHCFDLDQVNEAVVSAAEFSGLDYAVVVPDQKGNRW